MASSTERRAGFVLRGVLRSHGPGTWTYLNLDRAASARLGTRGKVRVRGRLGPVPFETTAIPSGDGTHILLVTKPIQAAAGVAAGDRIAVSITPLRRPRSNRVPSELSEALKAHPKAAEAYRALAASHQRAWAEYVGSASRPETRARRVARVIEGLGASPREPPR